MPNYDGSLTEPLVLPSRIPNLLVNGSYGIAVGMATNVPPHNLAEVVDGLCAMIDNPEITIDELMKYIKGPDFPTAAIIQGHKGIEDTYRTGRGSITVRARVDIEEMERGKNRIIVTELPYQVNKARLVEMIADLSRQKVIDGITALRDESDRSGMRIVIELRSDVNPQIMLNNLYKHTQMQVNFGSIMLALVDGHPRILNLQQILNYTKQIGHHNLNVMLGHESYQNRIYLLSASKSNMLTQDNDELAGAIIDKQGAGSYRREYNNEGYFARVMYDYAGKYFASASYRRDASSRFHPDHRWGNFWSLGGAWIISKENFMESTYEWLDNLKLKASIGSQGNDNIGNFRYTNTYTIENANGKVSTVFNAKGSENITWETNSNFNAGVEFSFLRGTVSGGVEYFLRKTTDMLLSFPVAPSLGYSSYYANVGDMRNSGVEIELNFTPIRREHVQWDINLNMTHLRNKITMLPSERRTKQVDGYSGYVSGSTFFGEGLPMYTFYMRKYAGVSDEGLSMWYMDETDDKGNPTGKRVTTTEYAKASDYLCGDPIPDLYGGFGTSVNFRGFDLSVAFTYQIGGLAYDSGYSAAMYSPANKTTGMNWHKDILNAWSADNASSNIPRLQYEDKDQNGMSDRFLTDASYLNLQNINFGYTLPSNFTKKVGIEKVRVYLACENVWYWSKRQGFDPRYSYSGSTSQATYSPVRTISGGINIQF